MKIKSVRCVCFSPTGTTKTITESITQGISPEFVEMIDITKRSERNDQPLLGEGDIVILSIPVYYGRVPEEILPYLTSLKAKQNPVVLVAVYGNRAFEDALKELHDIAVNAEFIPVAGEPLLPSIRILQRLIRLHPIVLMKVICEKHRSLVLRFEKNCKAWNHRGI